MLASPGATDRPYAAAVAASAGLQHHQLDLSLEEVLRELPTCVRVLQTFDPMTLRNDVAVCAALRAAAAAGFTCAVTGDAADELFGGYSFSHRWAGASWQDGTQCTRGLGNGVPANATDTNGTPRLAMPCTARLQASLCANPCRAVITVCPCLQAGRCSVAAQPGAHGQPHALWQCALG